MHFKLTDFQILAQFWKVSATMAMTKHFQVTAALSGASESHP